VPALLVGGHAVRALEDGFLDAAVRRDLDGVPDGEAVWGDGVVSLVHPPVHWEPHGLSFGRGPQPGSGRPDVVHRFEFKLDQMNGRGRVEAAISMGVADRPPVGAWGHTYREEWSPEALAAITVQRARQFGWDFVKFQPRASSFAEAFGSVYKPAGHRLKGPVLVSPAVPDLDSWRNVKLVNPKALDDQVESIGMVARELGRDVPVIQTVFSPITVGGYLVGKSSARVRHELRQHPELVRPALDRIAEALVDFGLRSVEAGAAGIFYAISGYTSKDAMSEIAYREQLLPYDVAVLKQMPAEAWFNVVHLCGSNLNFGLARDIPAHVVSWSIHNQGNPSLAEGRKLSGRAVMGGLGQRASLLYGPPPEVEAEARRAVAETGGRGLLLAPGCSVPTRAKDVNLAAMVSAFAA
jgi:uroporphyrinogen decarboxylase